MASAGGWLFDQAMAGWDVAVLTPDQTDIRPLQILGASAHDLEHVLTAPVRFGPCLQAIAVVADLYRSDQRVRRLVHTALEEGPAELRLWGQEWPDDLGGAPDPVRHRLSIAARAFKAQALAAADVPAGRCVDTETFRSPRRQPVLAAVR